MFRHSITSLAFCAMALGTVSGAEFAPKPFDWPQWQGPDRNAMVKETGLLASWPKEGPTKVWNVKGLGGGYSTPSVAAGRIFGMSFRGNDEVVWALDETDGKELWVQRIAAAAVKVGYGEGPRCTPTVDGDLVYAIGVSGDLVCLEVTKGKILWQKNLKKDFDGARPNWGYSESPLIDGDKLICTPGEKKATLVALNKKTGKEIWKGLVPKGDPAAYSSVIVAEINGQRQYVQFLKGGVVGLSADKGKFLWRYDKPANGTANCSTPIVQENYVFAASAYNTGGGLAKLSGSGNAIKAEQVYFTKNMQNHHGGMIVVDGALYGANGGNGGGKLFCLKFMTGDVLWEHAGKGSIAYADGRFYYRDEKGPMVLFEANAKTYVETGRFEQPERSKQNAWPHPVIANGKLYLRDQDVLLCYDIKAK